MSAGHRKRFVIVGMVALTAAALAAIPANAAGRSCGTVHGGGTTVSEAPVWRVEIGRGPVTCAQARAAVKNYVSGHGKFHGPPNGPRAKQYVTLPGGWRCSVLEQGGAACQRGGTRRDPREEIGFSQLPVAVARATAQARSSDPTSFTVAGELRGVAAVSAANAWAIGATGSGKTLILHWNGTAWTPVPNPAPAGSILYGVAATSAGSAWVVGCSGCSGGIGAPLIMQWSGTAWELVASPAPAGSSLNRVAATSAPNAWAVGSAGGGKTLILHWDGSAWTRVASPSPAGSSLSDVAGTSATNAWAVGATRSGNTLIMHWNGSVWKRVPSPSSSEMGVFDYLEAVAATPAGGVWAVGSSTNCGCGPGASLIERWNGRVWKQVRSPGPGGYALASVAAVSATSAWVVGESGEGDSPTHAVMSRWNGRAWKSVAIPHPGAYGSLAGVAATSSSNAWAVGTSYTANRGQPGGSHFKTVILHWNGTKWT